MSIYCSPKSEPPIQTSPLGNKCVYSIFYHIYALMNRHLHSTCFYSNLFSYLDSFLLLIVYPLENWILGALKILTAHFFSSGASLPAFRPIDTTLVWGDILKTWSVKMICIQSPKGREVIRMQIPICFWFVKNSDLTEYHLVPIICKTFKIKILVPNLD